MKVATHGEGEQGQSMGSPGKTVTGKVGVVGAGKGRRLCDGGIEVCVNK